MPVDSHCGESADNLNQPSAKKIGSTLMTAVASRLSLAECVEATIQDHVAGVHFRYDPNSLDKLNCFGNNYMLCEKERYRENNYWHNIHSKQY